MIWAISHKFATERQFSRVPNESVPVHGNWKLSGISWGARTCPFAAIKCRLTSNLLSKQNTHTHKKKTTANQKQYTCHILDRLHLIVRHCCMISAKRRERKTKSHTRTNEKEKWKKVQSNKHSIWILFRPIRILTFANFSSSARTAETAIDDKRKKN